jgi:serine/threonine-protein kinase
VSGARDPSDPSTALGAGDTDLDARRGPSLGAPSMAQMESIVRACERLEEAWRAGTPPRIESYVKEVGESERASLLHELLAIDLLFRRSQGERPGAWEFRQQFPRPTSLVDESFTEAEDRSRTSRTSGTLADSEGTASYPPDTFSGEAAAEGHPGRAWSGPPRRIGDYEVIEHVGSGGMGAVYKVRDQALGRVVALKIARHLGNPDGPTMDRFFRAARIVARLSHPSIVPIFDVGQVDGSPYIVSQFIEGEDLSALSRRAGRLPPHDAARIIAEVADAVQFAHDRGVIHRDIKPSNILIETDGHAVLSDFGLARSFAIDEEASLTIEGDIAGTPCYMSPEQARNGLAATGPASDVYSLGAALYAVLIGQPPLRGPSPVETLRQILDEVEPAPPRRLEPSVPRDLEAICLKALCKEPAGRYDSAGSMAADLRRFLDGRPILARPHGAAVRVARWVRRRPARVAVFLLALAALALIAFQQVKLQEARRRLDAESPPALRRAINRPQEAELWRAIEVGEAGTRARPEGLEGRRTLASNYRRLGDLLVNTNRLAEATWAYERAILHLRQHLRDARRDSAPRAELAEVLGNLGETAWTLGRAREARQAYSDALVVRRGLVADHPASPAYRDDLARTLNRLHQLSSTDGPEAGM